jgi:hypothetical protein
MSGKPACRGLQYPTGRGVSPTPHGTGRRKTREPRAFKVSGNYDFDKGGKKKRPLAGIAQGPKIRGVCLVENP